jgi:DNA-directed RNA polymerase subunit RPC12/RpoP
MAADFISVRCPGCQKKLRIPLTAAGKKVQCPSCAKRLLIPADIVAKEPTPAAHLQPIVQPMENPEASAGMFDFFSDEDQAGGEEEEVTDPDFFTVVEPKGFISNQFYRVYYDDKDIVAVWIGSGDDISAAISAASGLIGGLIGGAFAVRTAMKNAKRQAEIKDISFADLKKSHPNNFTMAMADIESAEFSPVTAKWRLKYSRIPFTALLKFTVDGEEKTVIAATNDDLGVAIRTMKRLLGSRAKVRVDYRK